MLQLPQTFHCRQCDHWITMDEAPDRIPHCPGCGRVMRAAWEREGREAPAVLIHPAADGRDDDE